ncbi:MAG: M20 family metallopeptidase [Gaiellales bacterium]
MNDRDRAVLSVLAAREAELLELARELVATPSPNPPGDERAAAEIASQAMRGLGFRDVTSLGLEDARPNVVGTVGAPTGRTLLLNGHLDTKPAGNLEEWRTGPWDPVVEDGRLCGLGSTDMKGAVAAMIHAGGALHESGALTDGRLRLALVADEEAGSRFGAAYLAGRPEAAADAVIVCEPTGTTSGWEYIAAASRGISCFRIVVRGTQMHSSLSDRLPSVNASVELARLLTRLADEWRPSFDPHPAIPGGPTVNAGVTLSGGVFFGIYPGEAEFGVDVRTVPGMTLERLRSDLGAFLDRLRADRPDLDARVEWVPDLEWFPPSWIDPDHSVVRAARTAATEVLGRDVPVGIMPAFTDGTHWSLAGIPTVPAFGPGRLPLAHRPNEWLSVQELHEAARIYALSALRFCAPG